MMETVKLSITEFIAQAPNHPVIKVYDNDEEEWMVVEDYEYSLEGDYLVLMSEDSDYEYHGNDTVEVKWVVEND